MSQFLHFTMVFHCRGVQCRTIGSIWDHQAPRQPWQARYRDLLIEPPGHVKVLFEYNDTYPGPPTMESEYAWLDLLPGKIA